MESRQVRDNLTGGKQGKSYLSLWNILRVRTQVNSFFVLSFCAHPFFCALANLKTPKLFAHLFCTDFGAQKTKFLA